MNYYRVPEGLVWRPSGSEDSQLNVIFRVENELNFFSGGDLDNLTGDTAADNDPAIVATGTQGYVYPSELCQQFMVFLHGEVVGARQRVL
jgi:hypothetical protein